MISKTFGRSAAPALTLQKNSGGRIEGLYLGPTESGEWRVMLKNHGQLSSAAQPSLTCPEVDRVLGDTLAMP